MDNDTSSTNNAILPCAIPRSSSTQNVGTSCDKLLYLPCFSNNDASNSSRSCVITNHVEERNELKAQATSLKKEKTAYEILRSDWSSDVCSSDLCYLDSDRLMS